MRRVVVAERVVLAALFAAWTLAGCTEREQAPHVPIRIGWQVPWATQGQIAQTLARTNALELNGIRGDFKGFNYGAPLNEAALAGEVDVIFTADQPAAMLLAREARWSIVARLMYNRVAIYVPPDSPIRSVTDLRGKKIAMPFGAAAQRVALKAIQDAGLDPVRDVSSVNLDIYEQAGIIQAGTRVQWGAIDAMVGFDPTPAMFEHEGKARMLHTGRVLSLVLMSSDFLSRNSVAAVGFLRAFAEAYFYYATHREQADEWFRQASRLVFDPAVLALAASVEPNVGARRLADVRIVLDEDDLKVLDEAAAFLTAQGLVKRPVDMRSHVDMTLARAAMNALHGDRYDAGQVRTLSPPDAAGTTSGRRP
jgi:sulfonate transport system substrate-binding protein